MSLPPSFSQSFVISFPLLEAFFFSATCKMSVLTRTLSKVEFQRESSTKSRPTNPAKKFSMPGNSPSPLRCSFLLKMEDVLLWKSLTHFPSPELTILTTNVCLLLSLPLPKTLPTEAPAVGPPGPGNTRRFCHSYLVLQPAGKTESPTLTSLFTLEWPIC